MMLFKTSLLSVVVLAATTVSAAPPDPLMWIWQRAWPRSQQKQHAPVVPPVIVLPPVVALPPMETVKPGTPAGREITPIPKHRPPPPIIRPEKRERVTVKKQRIAARGGLPSCAYVKREYDRMSVGQRWAAYLAATSEQVAHGKRCLGL